MMTEQAREADLPNRPRPSHRRVGLTKPPSFCLQSSRLQARLSGLHASPFSSQGFRVMVDQLPDGQVSVTATVKIQVGDREEHTAAEGDGPVHALDRAFKKASGASSPRSETSA